MGKKLAWLALALVLLGGQPAHAALVSTVNTDTTSQLDISWYWDESGSASDTPLLVNWPETVQLTFQNWLIVEVGEPARGNGSLLISPVSGPIGFGALISFYDNQYGLIRDTGLNTSYAHYHFIYNRNSDPALSEIRLTAVLPVPLPGAIFLLGPGLACLAVFRRKYSLRRNLK